MNNHYVGTTLWGSVHITNLVVMFCPSFPNLALKFSPPVGPMGIADELGGVARSSGNGRHH